MRSLNLFILVSTALHAMVLLALPHMDLRTLAEAAPLQVTLEPARPLPMAPQVASVDKPQRQSRQPEDSAPARKPRRQIETATVLAVPRELGLPEPLVSVPAPERRAAMDPPAPAPTPPERERAVAKIESASPEQTSPPVFNAAYLRNPEPRYPLSARRRGEQGTVVIKVLVTREGTAGSVSVDKGSGSTALDQAALETVRTWRFTPARRGEEAIESSVLVPVVFRLEGAS